MGDDRTRQPAGDYRRRAADLEPDDEARLGRPWRALRRAQTMAVLTLLDLNEQVVARSTRARPSRWPSHLWPWIAGAEATTPTIRAEIDRYLARGPAPLVTEMTGFDATSGRAGTTIPTDAGSWRDVMLFVNGRWVAETARHFPQTVAALREVRGKANVGFSILGPGGRVAPHRDPNRGALRFQLPITVPGDAGQCRIRIGDDLVHWREAESLVFDLAVEHEAWNDSDGERVLLLGEILMPLPRPVAALNRLVQRCYRWHPHMRRMHARAAAFGRAHDCASTVHAS